MAESGMKGKTCLVTGGNSGIGKETAVALASKGAEVVIVSRDRKRGEAALAEIKERSGSRAASLLVADLSSQAEIRRLAEEVLASVPRLDVLVNNAGAINAERTVTVDGIETTFAVNHLSYFLLTQLLLERLESSAPARIVNVASEAHRGASIDFDDLLGERRYSSWRAYGQSKLANIMFTYELARRLDASRVTANCLHPGVISSNFGRSGSWIFKLIWTVGGPFMTTPEKGARTSVFLASSPAVEGVTGKYFVDSKEATSNAASYDEAAAARLWEVSERMTGLHAARARM